MKDITSKYNINKLTESASTSENTVDEVKEASRNRKKSLIKLVAINILLAFMIIFTSFTWFTHNREVETDDMTIVSDTPKYEISVLQGGNNGIYYDYHKSVQNSSAIVWQMTEENNMDNYNSSKGIHPGSCGVISFYITPKVESVDLKFTFEVVGYVSKETSNGDEKNITMESLEQDSVSAKYLNGHILLFEERSGNTDSYTYSKPILSDEDMKRVISSNTYTGKGVLKKVDIYWVWPNTLSTLVDARSCTTITVQEEPFTKDDDYNKIVENIITYPDYYLKNTSQSEQEGEGTGTTPGQTEEENLTKEIIAEKYDKYGDLYDQADNDIGMGVDFILLKLSVTEADSNGE